MSTKISRKRWNDFEPSEENLEKIEKTKMTNHFLDKNKIALSESARQFCQFKCFCHD